MDDDGSTLHGDACHLLNPYQLIASLEFAGPSEQRDVIVWRTAETLLATNVQSLVLS